jgi:hypothetical protein
VTDIFREVDEDLRRDQAIVLWRKYGRLVMVFAVAAVLATAGFVAWQNYSETRRDAAARSYAQAMELVAKNDVASAAAAMADVASGGTAYRQLALLQEAALEAKAGKAAEAAAIYDRLAADDSADQAFRDLATILSAMIGLEGSDQAAPNWPAMEKKLQPLAAEGQAFRPSALELLGYVAIKRGDFTTAKSRFRAIADDMAAPTGLRQRATQVLAWIGDKGGA